ncbi:MAG: acetolactate synthase 3 large subunit, partial [Alphaproteobacteria bacterium]|nr:acetolactate synthase 3 large subunit [Alphaproteobacteria bacterium]
YRPVLSPDKAAIKKAVQMMKAAKRPVIYGGGGIINSGPEATKGLRKLVEVTGWPTTLTLMGLGALPADDPHFLGMLGMHGTYEANLTMHGCDFMLNLGARFDDRVTGRLNAFSPNSVKVHADIDPASVNKVVRVDLAIIGDVKQTIAALLEEMKAQNFAPNTKALSGWWD